MSEFLDRFVHPRLAILTLLGIGIWLLSFVVAASGVALRGMGAYSTAALAFFYSGVIGLLGIGLLGVATLWLLVLFGLRFVRSRRDGTATESADE